MKNKIAVITYDFPHRKTQDTIFKLKARGNHDVHLLALPFIKRENPFQPIYSHRPSHCENIYPQELAENFGYQFKKITKETILEVLNLLEPDFILIAGAGILSAELVDKHKIINSHPAYLPWVRGLDALKWAIVEKQKIGVTSHFVVAKADAGYMIDQKEVEVLPNDTFHSLAMRQYELEIDMLVEAISLVPKKENFPALEEKGEVHRRMPKAIEKDLMVKFEDYKKAKNL